MAREFMARSNEQARLTLRGAKVVTEQSIATVREPPALMAAIAVARTAEVSEQSIATVREPPALMAPIAIARTAEVSEQTIAAVREPPALMAPMAVVRIAEVSEQNVAIAHEPPAPVARMAVVRIAEVSDQIHRHCVQTSGVLRSKRCHCARTPNSGGTDGNSTDNGGLRAERCHCARTPSSGGTDDRVRADLGSDDAHDERRVGRGVPSGRRRETGWSQVRDRAPA